MKEYLCLKKVRRFYKLRRKRGVWLLLGVLFAVLFFAVSPKLSVSAYTPEEEQALEEFRLQIDELLDALDTDELQAYLNSLSEFDQSDIKDVLSGVITGNFALDYTSLGQSVLAIVWQEGRAMLPAFAIILAAALLCGILNSAKNGFMQSNMTDIINFSAYLAIGAVVLAVLTDLLKVGFEAIQSMQTQMEIVYPILLTLMAASGGSVSVGVFRPAVAFFSGAVCELFTAVVLPASVVVIVLAFIGNLSPEVPTEKLGDFFKSISKWLIGLTLGLFTLFLTVQGIASSQYDGLSLRAVKYLVSGSVPIVGGFLSGGMDLVLAGSALIKNAVGSFAVFLLFGAILRPVLLFAAFQLFLRLAAAVTEPAGGKLSSFLSRLATDSGFFLAGLLCIAFLYFLTLVLLVCSTGVIF